LPDDGPAHVGSLRPHEGDRYVYRVCVMVSLLAHDGMMGLSRWLFLPFAPFPGLDLYGITSDSDHPETVEGVSWDVSAGHFLVELQDCEDPVECLSGLIDYFGPEWDLHEPGFEPVGEV
jgi:hypothetical protein